MSAECTRRIVAVEGAIKALCSRLVVVDLSSRTSKDLGEQCVKVSQDRKLHIALLYISINFSYMQWDCATLYNWRVISSLRLRKGNAITNMLYHFVLNWNKWLKKKHLFSTCTGITLQCLKRSWRYFTPVFEILNFHQGLRHISLRIVYWYFEVRSDYNKVTRWCEGLCNKMLCVWLLLLPKQVFVIHLLTALVPALIQASFNLNDLFRNPNSVSGVEVFTNILTVTRSKFF